MASTLNYFVRAFRSCGGRDNKIVATSSLTHALVLQLARNAVQRKTNGCGVAGGANSSFRARRGSRLKSVPRCRARPCGPTFCFCGAACPIGNGRHPVSRRTKAESRAVRPTPGKSFHPCLARVIRSYRSNCVYITST